MPSRFLSYRKYICFQNINAESEAECTFSIHTGGLVFSCLFVNLNRLDAFRFSEVAGVLFVGGIVEVADERAV